MRRTVTALACATIAMLGAAPAVAKAPSVAERETVQRHTNGVDHYEVWVCEVPVDSTSGDWEELPERLALTAESAAEQLTDAAVDYFRWLSQGQYEPSFEARGSISLGPDDEFGDCGKRAGKLSAGAEGAVAVSNVAGDVTAFAGPESCQDRVNRIDPCAGKPKVLPRSHRVVHLGGFIFAPYQGNGPLTMTIPHELGHALTWPHSFTGRAYVDIEGVPVGIEYDDPVDIMAFTPVWSRDVSYLALESVDWTVPKATQVFNRYAAGWLPPGAAVTHSGSRAQTYEVEAIGSGGVELVAVPGASRATYLTIESRLRRGYDVALPHEGVSLHVVDQRASACRPSDPDAKGCWGESVRLLPAPTKPNSLRAFIRPGESREFGDVTVRVLSRTDDGFRVHVSRGHAKFPRTIPLHCLAVPSDC